MQHKLVFHNKVLEKKTFYPFLDRTHLNDCEILLYCLLVISKSFVSCFDRYFDVLLMSVHNKFGRCILYA